MVWVPACSGELVWVGQGVKVSRILKATLWLVTPTFRAALFSPLPLLAVVRCVTAAFPRLGERLRHLKLRLLQVTEPFFHLAAPFRQVADPLFPVTELLFQVTECLRLGAESFSHSRTLRQTNSETSS